MKAFRERVREARKDSVWYPATTAGNNNVATPERPQPPRARLRQRKPTGKIPPISDPIVIPRDNNKPDVSPLSALLMLDKMAADGIELTAPESLPAQLVSSASKKVTDAADALEEIHQAFARGCTSHEADQQQQAEIPLEPPSSASWIGRPCDKEQLQELRQAVGRLYEVFIGNSLSMTQKAQAAHIGSQRYVRRKAPPPQLELEMHQEDTEKTQDLGSPSVLMDFSNFTMSGSPTAVGSVASPPKQQPYIESVAKVPLIDTRRNALVPAVESAEDVAQDLSSSPDSESDSSRSSLSTKGDDGTDMDSDAASTAATSQSAASSIRHRGSCPTLKGILNASSEELSQSETEADGQALALRIRKSGLRRVASRPNLNALETISDVTPRPAHVSFANLPDAYAEHPDDWEHTKADLLVTPMAAEINKAITHAREHLGQDGHLDAPFVSATQQGNQAAYEFGMMPSPRRPPRSHKRRPTGIVDGQLCNVLDSTSPVCEMVFTPGAGGTKMPASRTTPPVAEGKEDVSPPAEADTAPATARNKAKNPESFVPRYPVCSQTYRGAPLKRGGSDTSDKRDRRRYEVTADDAQESKKSVQSTRSDGLERSPDSAVAIAISLDHEEDDEPPALPSKDAFASSPMSETFASKALLISKQQQADLDQHHDNAEAALASFYASTRAEEQRAKNLERKASMLFQGSTNTAASSDVRPQVDHPHPRGRSKSSSSAGGSKSHRMRTVAAAVLFGTAPSNPSAPPPVPTLPSLPSVPSRTRFNAQVALVKHDGGYHRHALNKHGKGERSKIVFADEAKEQTMALTMTTRNRSDSNSTSERPLVRSGEVIKRKKSLAALRLT